jgi:hypothetical protein
MVATIMKVMMIVHCALIIIIIIFIENKNKHCLHCSQRGSNKQCLTSLV